MGSSLNFTLEQIILFIFFFSLQNLKNKEGQFLNVRMVSFWKEAFCKEWSLNLRKNYLLPPSGQTAEVKILSVKLAISFKCYGAYPIAQMSDGWKSAKQIQTLIPFYPSLSFAPFRLWAIRQTVHLHV